MVVEDGMGDAVARRALLPFKLAAASISFVERSDHVWRFGRR